MTCSLDFITFKSEQQIPLPSHSKDNILHQHPGIFQNIKSASPKTNWPPVYCDQWCFSTAGAETLKKAEMYLRKMRGGNQDEQRHARLTCMTSSHLFTPSSLCNLTDTHALTSTHVHACRLSWAHALVSLRHLWHTCPSPASMQAADPPLKTPRCHITEGGDGSGSPASCRRGRCTHIIIPSPHMQQHHTGLSQHRTAPESYRLYLMTARPQTPHASLFLLLPLHFFSFTAALSVSRAPRICQNYPSLVSVVTP